MKSAIQNAIILIGLILLTSCAGNKSAQEENVVATPVRADQIVFVSSFIPYEKGDTVADDIRSECRWNTTMPLYMQSESEGVVKVLDSKSFDTASGKKLILVATELHAPGGGMMSGPKWLQLEGKLTEGDNLLGNFIVKSNTTGGFGLAGAFKKSCSIVENLSEYVAEYIVEWLKAPSMNAKLGDAK